MQNCLVFQRNKYDLADKPCLFQPLPFPEGIWQSISMNFIEGLPLSFSKHCILVVVDKLSKHAHFIPLSYCKLLLKWLRFTWTMCLSFMGCYKISLVIGVLHSSVKFGQSYLGFMELIFAFQELTILKPTGRLR